MQTVKQKLWHGFLDTSRSTCLILLVVLFVRSFIFEPYRIPSGSLRPTLKVGDFIYVNKFSYGFKLPVFNITLIPTWQPQRGQIAVVKWPASPDKYDFIKRVIGVPGDIVSYKNKELFINGKPATQSADGTAIDSDEAERQTWSVVQRTEDFAGIKHQIYVNPQRPGVDFSYKIPKGYYFLMGDNRDNSLDSRYWGLVPFSYFKGKAEFVIFSWDNADHKIRWSRIGKVIH